MAWQFTITDFDAHKYLGILARVVQRELEVELSTLPLESVKAEFTDNGEYIITVESTLNDTPYGVNQVFKLKQNEWLVEDDTSLGTFKVLTNRELLSLTSS